MILSFSDDGRGSPQVNVHFPAATPHLIALFCAQFPLIMTDGMRKIGDFSYYPISEEMFRDHFTHSVRNFEAQRYHSMLLSTLVHRDYNHWFSNFAVTALRASSLIPVIGGPMFWFVYGVSALGGDLASVLKYRFHFRKTQWNRKPGVSAAAKGGAEQASQLFTRVLDRVRGTDSPPSSSSSAAAVGSSSSESSSFDFSVTSLLGIPMDWDSMMQSLSKNGTYLHDSAMETLFRLVNESTLSLGSSAAVNGLCGFDCAMTAHKLWLRYQRVVYYVQWRRMQERQQRAMNPRDRRQNGNIRGLGDLRGMPNQGGDDAGWLGFEALSRGEWLDTLFSLLSVYFDLRRVSQDLWMVWQDMSDIDWADLVGLRGGSAPRKTELDHLVLPSSQNVGHVAHVGGFLTGVACFIGYHWYQKQKGFQQSGNQFHLFGDAEDEREHREEQSNQLYSGDSYQWGRGHRLGGIDDNASGSIPPAKKDWNSIQHV